MVKFLAVPSGVTKSCETSSLLHSIGYEITFFSVNTSQMATTPIKTIHFDISLEISLLIIKEKPIYFYPVK
tara:strand:- start:770 stop:982 length:213 start_codon:yes stop_codon:yes gene_type:complete